MPRPGRWIVGSIAVVALGEAVLIRVGRTYGSTEQERARRLPGDDIVTERVPASPP